METAQDVYASKKKLRGKEVVAVMESYLWTRPTIMAHSKIGKKYNKINFEMYSLDFFFKFQTFDKVINVRVSLVVG